MPTIIFDFDGTIADTFDIASNIIINNSKYLKCKQLTKQEVLDLKDLHAKEVLKYLNIAFWRAPLFVRRLRKLMMFFGIFTKHDNTFCGCIWYAGINWFVPRFEVAYWQSSHQCGNGYMTEAVNALTRLTFILYKAKRVEIKIFINNKKSRALAERLRFKLEAIMKNYFIDFVTNEIVDGVVYASGDIKRLQKLNLHYDA